MTSVLIKLQYYSKEGIEQLRSSLAELKCQLLTDRTALSQSCESLSSSWENLLVERDSKEKELIHNLKTKHNKEIEQYIAQEATTTSLLETVKIEKENLEKEMSKTNEALKELRDTLDGQIGENMIKIEELQKQLLEKDVVKEKSVKEATDRLVRDHKVEIENIRSRFKLMTMERSPSDTSLEKSGDFSNLPSHSTLLIQMTENFEMDKERAVNEALVKERGKWEKILEIKIQGLESKFEVEKEQLLRQVCEEKDRQIDNLREREKNLNLECMKYKDTIQQLAETEKEPYDSDLLERINYMQKEKDALEDELERLKQQLKFSIGAVTNEGKHFIYI